MNHSSKPSLFPWVPLLAGGIGFILRRWLLSTADAENLLPKNHIAGTLSFLLLALVLGICFLQVRKCSPHAFYTQLFPRSNSAAIGMLLGAIGIGSTVFSLEHVGFLRILVPVFGILGTLSLGVIAYLRAQGKRPHCLFHCAVILYLIFRTVSLCRSWGAEPQLQLYFFQLLASLFLLMAAYYRAELSIQGGDCRRYAFFNQAALFCCCLSIPGPNSLFYLSAAIWMAFDTCTLPNRQAEFLSEAALICIQTLEKAGYKVYAVGGCVRDSLLGQTPHDCDLCTNATPAETAQLFSQYTLVRSGEQHGTIGVVIQSEFIEITTFRTEGGYQDGRHPDWVQFMPNVEDDLARRDFTVNAIAYNPRHGYVDPFRGQEDLENRILRTVGDPQDRFTEDSLRILRGVRFAIRYDLTPDPETLQAMKTLAPLMKNLAVERVYSELCKLLPLISAQNLLDYAPILLEALPELAPCLNFSQHSVHHAFDVYTHTAFVVEATPPRLAVRWAALLHDCGKPACFQADADGTGHFYGHAQQSAQIAEELLLRLKAPTALREQVVFLIAHHMTPLEPDKPQLRRKLGRYGRQALEDLIDLQQADHTGKGTGEETEQFQILRELLAELEAEQACLTVKDLQINGRDLLELGFAPGPRLGECLQHLLYQVQDELLPNERTALLSAATDFLCE